MKIEQDEHLNKSVHPEQFLARTAYSCPVVAGTGPASADLNAPALTGIRRLTALDTVRARIAMAVDLGLLVPGERLPPNAEIAGALGVGEMTVRRALTSLCDDGVLIRRRGRTGGTLVADHPTAGRVAETLAYEAAAADVHRLIDQRVLLEVAVAHLAALNATAEQLSTLEQLVASMDAARTWAQFHTADERFHLAVARAGVSPGAAAHYSAVLQDLYRYYLPYPIDYLHSSNAEHARLVAALRARDPIAAAELARRHVDVLHEAMFVGLATPTAGSSL
jgi:DNA-binding FadR family transcriptional regulator